MDSGGFAALHRRVASGLTAFVVFAATVLLGHLSALAASPTIDLEPENRNNRGVKAGHIVAADGRVPPGTVRSAQLAALSASGGVLAVKSVPAQAIRPPTSTGDYVWNDNGHLTASLTLPCLFANPAHTTCAPSGVRAVRLDVAIGNENASSDTVRVDYTDPFVRGYEVVGTSRIRVVFSEPVRHPEGEDHATESTDWKVTNPERSVIDVEPAEDGDCVGRYASNEDAAAGPSGCTRTLVLAAPVGEDARPFVSYEVNRLRPAFQDYTGNTADKSKPSTRSDALDLVRPAAPKVETVNGSAARERVVAASATPRVSVSNVTQGHSVRLLVLSPDGLQEVTASSWVTADRSTIELEAPQLADGEYVLRPQARDVNGNLSTDGAKNPPRADGTPSKVSYVVDTVAPLVLSGTRRGTKSVVVTFSEPVFPNDNAGEWRINDRTVPASGSGNTRTLTTAENLPNEVTVSWVPVQGSAYSDEAGNVLEAQQLPVTPLPPIDPPVVLVPSGEVYTTERNVPLSGTAPLGTEVVIYDAGTDTERAIATTRPDATWAIDVPLPSDARYTFEVVAEDIESRARSPRRPVPHIVRDTKPPAVDVREPGPADAEEAVSNLDLRKRVGLGEPVRIAWAADDEHGDRNDVSIVYPARASVLASVPFNQTDYHHTITRGDLDAAGQDREVRFAVTGIDKAGNTSGERRAPFGVVIDPSILGFRPHFITNGTQPVIEARFDARLEGSTLPTDWRIKDGQDPDEEGPEVVAREATVREENGRTIVRLVASQPILDPNAVPEVRYRPAPVNGSRLRGPDGLEVTKNGLDSLNDIAPALSFAAPGPGPTSAGTVTVNGRTDASTRPNTVHVFRLDDHGASIGEAGRATANRDGTFSVTATLLPDRLNRLLVEARSPHGNVNHPPATAFAVVDDRTAPVVGITSPVANAPIGAHVPIRWTTKDAHPESVDLYYRVNNGDFTSIAHGEPDDGAFDWELPPAVSERDVVQIKVTANDKVALSTSAIQPGLLVDRVAPTLIRAISTSERTVDVVFDEPVVTAQGASGFSITQGPNVVAVEGTGARRTLRLASDLQTAEPEVVYSGSGVSDAGGNPAPPARLTAERGFAFPPTGLAAAADRGERSVTLSWVDDRNAPEHVVRYEIRRGDEVIGTTPPGTKRFVDVNVTSETVYGVVTVDDVGNVSRAATVTVDPGMPNIGPDGGVILSDDGQVALIVPPGAVTGRFFGALERIAAAERTGYRLLTDRYRIQLEPADNDPPPDRFARFATISFRPTTGLAGADPARVVVLRDNPTSPTEMASRRSQETAEADLLAFGTFTLAETPGVTQRVAGTDPVLPRDRFSTAAALSQSVFAPDGAAFAVLARADDYPDALAAAGLAADLRAPILLVQTSAIPPATQLELVRLGVQNVVLVGGHAAISEEVAAQARQAGLQVERVSGPTRFSTAVEIAERAGTRDGRAYVATGRNFADALSASAGSAALGRPIFLTEPDVLPDVTLRGLRAAGVSAVDLLGGRSAISAAVEDRLRAEGFQVRRIAGPDRYATSVELARALAADGLALTRPIAGSGQGDGRTSPDALAAGPIVAASRSPLLLVPRDGLHPAVADLLYEAERLESVTVAGGPAAVSADTRAQIDAVARR